MVKPQLEKDEEILLDIQESARRRIICGLRWDPLEETEPKKDDLLRGGNNSAHDLDLICITFDKYGRLLEGVTGQGEQRKGDRGNIYHTGDVVDGEDELDDEQLSLELFNLSSEIHQIFFIAEVQSGQNFTHIKNPEIRLANAINDRNFAHQYLGQGEAAKKNAYIFGSIFRTSRGWVFHFISEYADGNEIKDWEKKLEPHLNIVKGADGKPIQGPPRPAKGETVPLSYTREARHRFVCGLNWDPLEGDIGRIEKLQNLGQNISSFDLDLACVIYDENGEAVDGVSAKPDENMDSSGKIYHSGDDTSGQGDGVDDENISVELKDIPDYVHHIVFVAEIQSAHTFDEIINPSMRIADGKTNENQLTGYMDVAEGEGKNSFVFARVSRREDNWLLTNISEFFDGHEIEDWIEYLSRYLG